MYFNNTERYSHLCYVRLSLDSANGTTPTRLWPRQSKPHVLPRSIVFHPINRCLKTAGELRRWRKCLEPRPRLPTCEGTLCQKEAFAVIMTTRAMSGLSPEGGTHTGLPGCKPKTRMRIQHYCNRWRRRDRESLLGKRSPKVGSCW